MKASEEQELYLSYLWFHDTQNSAWHIVGAQWMKGAIPLFTIWHPPTQGLRNRTTHKNQNVLYLERRWEWGRQTLKMFCSSLSLLDFGSAEDRFKTAKKVQNASLPFLVSIFKHCSYSQTVKEYLFSLFSHRAFMILMLVFPVRESGCDYYMKVTIIIVQTYKH